MKRNKLVALLLCLAMMLSLAACGGSSNSSDDTSSSADDTSASDSGNTADSESDAGDADDAASTESVDPAAWTEADATETLNYHFSGSSNTLSKWSHTSNYFLSATNFLLFDALVIMDEDGNYGPWLAESYEMAEDGTSFTFTVRDGVYFTNGQQCTADDVIFTFEQIRDDVEHYPDSVAKNWRNYLGELEKIDEMTVKMNFTQAFPEFWKLAASPDVQIIPANAYDDKTWDEFWEAPIGTGAYQVVNFDSANSNLSLTLRTDENGYWGYDYAGTYTNVKDINIMYSPESTTRLASLRSGEVQLIDTVPTSEKANLDGEGFVTTLTVPGNCVFLEFACAENDAFGDAKLREALSLCIDRELIVEMLLDGYAFPANYLCLETDLGYQTEDEVTYYQYDVERAKELVAESSYNGEALEFIYTASTVNIGGELCQAIQSMASEVGINLEIKLLETAVYDDARSNHEYDVSLACIANSGNMWYKQAHDVTGEDRFNSGCTNEELIALGQALGQTSDQTEMDSILKQMYDIQMTTFEPYINVYYPTVIFAQQNNVNNIQWHNYLIPDLSAVVIG